MNTIRQRTGTSNTYRELSPDVWADMPLQTLRENPSAGFFRYEDWSDFPLIGTQTTQIGHGKYKLFADSGCSVSRVSAVNSVELLGGALQLAIDTDNDAASLAEAYPANIRLSGVVGTDGPAAFECCIAQASVATNMAASFIGLAETDQWTLAQGVPFNGGDAITNSASAIGFRIEEDGLGVIDTVVSDRATSFSNIGDTEGGTLTAYTFTKLGFIYDPTRVADCIRFFKNNVQCATVISRATLVAYTNLDANPLGFIIATCADSGGTSHKLFCKWAAWGQVYPHLSN